MADHAVPKGVSLETLREILAGWAAVGAATEPCYTADVADHVGVSDAVGRQSAFFEELGLLEAVGQEHRLTEAGAEVAGPLVVDDEEAAAAALRDALESWPVAERIRGLVASNPMSKDALVSLVTTITGHDEASARTTTGIGTLLELFAWSGILARDDEGRYRLPAADTEADDDGGHSDEATPSGDSVAERPLSEVDIGPGRRPSSDPATRPVVSVGPDETRVVGDERPVVVDTGPNAEVRLATGPDGRRHVRAAADGAGETTDNGTERRASSDSEPEAVATGNPEPLENALDGLDLTDVALQSAVENGDDHTLTLSVDADPDDIEALVRAIRRGLSKTE